MSTSLRPVLFLTDFGHEDEFAGVCRAVIDRIAPEARVIDLSHGVEPGDIRRGAIALAAAVPYAAASVLLAVVDPGVGTRRRAVLLSAGGYHLVGPDNGLLRPAADAAGGVEAAFDISGSPVRLEGAGRTFHGRDIFSPVAAHLALGADPAGLGEQIDPDSLVGLQLPVARVESGRIVATVLFSDRYGNVTLNVGAGLIDGSFLSPGARVRIEAGTGAASTVVFATAFGEVPTGDALLYPDSSGSLSLAVNRGDAAGRFGLDPDDEVVLSPA